MSDSKCQYIFSLVIKVDTLKFKKKKKKLKSWDLFSTKRIELWLKKIIILIIKNQLSKTIKSLWQDWGVSCLYILINVTSPAFLLVYIFIFFVILVISGYYLNDFADHFF